MPQRIEASLLNTPEALAEAQRLNDSMLASRVRSLRRELARIDRATVSPNVRREAAKLAEIAAGLSGLTLKNPAP